MTSFACDVEINESKTITEFVGGIFVFSINLSGWMRAGICSILTQKVCLAPGSVR